MPAARRRRANSNPAAAPEPRSEAAAPTEPPRGSPWDRLIPWLIAIVTAAVFARVLLHPFTPIDDPTTFVNNPRLNPPHLTGGPDGGVLWYWSHSETSLYIPVAYTAWAVLAKLTYVDVPDETGAHLDPRVFHAASLLAHVAAALAVYAILRRLLARPWPAAAGALLFALHPLQVETVAWTSGFKDVLGGALSLAAIALYLRSEDARGPRAGLPAYAAATACFVLAVLSKPGAVILPLLVGVITLAFPRRDRPTNLAPLARRLGPWAALAVLFAVIAKLAQPATSIPAPPLWQRPLIAAASLGFYLSKLAWPAGLAFEYGWRPVEMIGQGRTYIYAAVALTVCTIAVARWRTARPVAAGLAIVIAALLPVLGLIPFHFQAFSTVADHYIYLPMLGPALAVAWLLTQVPARRTALITGATTAVLAALAITSIVQLGHWRDDTAIYTRSLAVNPCSVLGLSGLSGQAETRGDLATAEALLRREIDCHPGDRAPREALIDLLVRANRPDDAIREVYAWDRALAATAHDTSPRDPTPVLTSAATRALDRGWPPAAAVRLLEEARTHHPSDPTLRAALERAQAAAATTR